MDNCLIWNSRGTKKAKKVAYLKRMISLHHPNIIVILEPKQQGSKIGHFASLINYPNYVQCFPLNKHIWILWDNNVVINVHAKSRQFVTVSAKWTQYDHSV